MKTKEIAFLHHTLMAKKELEAMQNDISSELNYFKLYQAISSINLARSYYNEAKKKSNAHQ